MMLRASILKTAFHAWLQYHSMKQTELVSIGIVYLLWHEVCLSSIKCAYTFPMVVVKATRLLVDIRVKKKLFHRYVYSMCNTFHSCSYICILQ